MTNEDSIFQVILTTLDFKSPDYWDDLEAWLNDNIGIEGIDWNYDHSFIGKRVFNFTNIEHKIHFALTWL